MPGLNWGKAEPGQVSQLIQLAGATAPLSEPARREQPVSSASEAFGDKGVAFREAGSDLDIRHPGFVIGMLMVRNDLDADIANLGVQLCKTRGEEMLPDLVDGDAHDLQSGLSKTGLGAHDPLGHASHILREGNEAGTGRRWTQALRRSIKQSNAQLLLEVAQSSAHLRLAEARGLRARRQAAVRRRGIEQAQIIPIHKGMLTGSIMQI